MASKKHTVDRGSPCPAFDELGSEWCFSFIIFLYLEEASWGVVVVASGGSPDLEVLSREYMWIYRDMFSMCIGSCWKRCFSYYNYYGYIYIYIANQFITGIQDHFLVLLFLRKIKVQYDMWYAKIRDTGQSLYESMGLSLGQRISGRRKWRQTWWGTWSAWLCWWLSPVDAVQVFIFISYIFVYVPLLPKVLHTFQVVSRIFFRHDE